MDDFTNVVIVWGCFQQCCVQFTIIKLEPVQLMILRSTQLSLLSTTLHVCDTGKFHLVSVTLNNFCYLALGIGIIIVVTVLTVVIYVKLKSKIFLVRHCCLLSQHFRWDLRF